MNSAPRRGVAAAATAGRAMALSLAEQAKSVAYSLSLRVLRGFLRFLGEFKIGSALIDLE
jgi:hypothetical protein